MGDRGNIVIVEEVDRNPIYLYTHWGGSEIQTMAQEALRKKWRWKDPSYLIRIIFDVMTENDHGSETGFGISTIEMHDEHPQVWINVPKQQVEIHSKGTVLNTYTFEEFCRLKIEEAH